MGVLVGDSTGELVGAVSIWPNPCCGIGVNAVTSPRGQISAPTLQGQTTSECYREIQPTLRAEK
jgi:hypothetical protein